MRFRARGAWHEWRRYHPGMTGIYSPTHWADSDFEEDTKYCGQCRPGGPLFFSHADCWKVAQRHDIDVNQLYTFAMQTQPLLPWKGDGPHTRLWGFFNCVGTLNTETELGEFLVEISRRLPPELHEDILADLQRSAGYKVRNICMDAAEFETMLKAGEVLFTRLAAVESQVVPTLKSISSRTTLVNLLPLKAPASLPDQFMSNVRDTFLWIRPTNIFGRAYISEVGVGQRRSGVLSIPLSQNQITGLRFALGKFGVRAIRILYDGGSKSAWLGDPSGCWFGNVPGTNIRDLATTADVRPTLYSVHTHHPLYKRPRANLSIIIQGLRVVRLDLDRGSILNGKRNMFLDTEIDTLPGELVPFSANDQALRPPLMTNPYYRRWDLLTCLPLMFGLCYTSGLTVYWDDYTVIGMVSYGPENQSAFVGRRSKNAMHVSLATKEFFTTFWVGSSNFTHVLRGRPFVLSVSTA